MFTQLQLLLLCTLISPIFCIFGGQNAEEGQFPYMVSLRFNNYHFCGGAIINENYILTSAYCKPKGSIERVTAVVATVDKVNGGVHYNVTSYLNHEKWSPASQRYDIALVRVANPIVFNESVQPVKLPTQLFDDKEIATVAGYGIVSLPNGPSKYLRWISTRILNLDRCRIANAPVMVYDTQICSHPDAGQGICDGDIGGPMVSNGTVIGIASKSTYYCGSGLHDFYTSVYSYMDWISINMN